MLRVEGDVVRRVVKAVAADSIFRVSRYYFFKARNKRHNARMNCRPV